MIIAALVLRALRPNTRITAPPVPREDHRDPKWHDFERRFLVALRQASISGENRAPGYDVWRMAVTHPCYQEELDRRAKRVLYRSGAPLQWLADIKQEALLSFAGNLQRRIALKDRPLCVDGYFVAWLRCVITRDCRQALRRMRRQFGPKDRAAVAQRTAFDWPAIEDQLDLQAAIERLTEPARTVIVLRRSGFAVSEIAGQLQLSKRTTYRLLARGLRHLRQDCGVTSERLPSTESQES